jgi:hypothetical protein
MKAHDPAVFFGVSFDEKASRARPDCAVEVSARRSQAVRGIASRGSTTPGDVADLAQVLHLKIRTDISFACGL